MEPLILVAWYVVLWGLAVFALVWLDPLNRKGGTK
jgi:hypothetical protein